MDDSIRKREIDDVDAGLAAQEVLQRTAETERRKVNQALADLSALASDEEILDTYGVDMAQMRREVDWGQIWSLP